MTEKITVWITKHALTSGIMRKEAKIWSSGKIISTGSYDSGTLCHYHRKDWHRTLEAAQERAMAMRDAKARTLRKQLARLEVLDFTVEKEEKA